MITVAFNLRLSLDLSVYNFQAKSKDYPNSISKHIHLMIFILNDKNQFSNVDHKNTSKSSIVAKLCIQQAYCPMHQLLDRTPAVTVQLWPCGHLHPQYLSGCFPSLDTSWSCGVVVITSALHAEGPQFDPGRDQYLFSINKNYFQFNN